MKLIIGALMIAAAMPAHALYKCEANGRVVYQDKPCAGGGTEIKVQGKARAQAHPFSATDEEIREWRKNGAWRIAMDSKLVLVGMPEKLAWTILGRPDDINTTTTQHGSRSQWVYRVPGLNRSRYVYVEDGKVVATQN